MNVLEDKLDNYRLSLNGKNFVPIMIGGMGVDISTVELALEAARLGGIGHISDAMSPFVSDRRFKTHFSKTKADANKECAGDLDKSSVHFCLNDLREAQQNLVRSAMENKQGDGAIFINIMEKLTMADPLPSLEARLLTALDEGIDGITLSAGLHNNSLRMMENHKRFRDVLLGPIVSSARALRIFLRSAKRSNRLPDYIVVEGPLAGGHLGFGLDWKKYQLETIVDEVLAFLKENDLNIPVIPAGGIFTGTDATSYIHRGASGVQVATRFTVAKECGLPDVVKQKYFKAKEEEVVVNTVSPTGYPIRMLTTSPCLSSNIKPQCEPFGYVLEKGKCQYLDAYQETPCDAEGKKLPVEGKICLCHHFSKHNCYTCGHYVYRLKDTTTKLADGTYLIPTAEEVFKDYQFSRNHEVQRAVTELSNGHLGSHPTNSAQV
ncbi:MAG: nitronate monooxygenase [Bdellovibrionales bacterium]|nr:nitronate monooxygenase [Bdellovibrionales bacterium]